MPENERETSEILACGKDLIVTIVGEFWPTEHKLLFIGEKG
jgi:hypothetical protein